MCITNYATNQANFGQILDVKFQFFPFRFLFLKCTLSQLGKLESRAIHFCGKFERNDKIRKKTIEFNKGASSLPFEVYNSENTMNTNPGVKISVS